MNGMVEQLTTSRDSSISVPSGTDTLRPVPFFPTKTLHRRQSTNSRNDTDLATFRHQFLEREKQMSEEFHTIRVNNERRESEVRLREIESRMEQRNVLFKKQEEFWNLTNETMRLRAMSAAGENIQQIVADVEQNDLIQNVLDSVQDGRAMGKIYPGSLPKQ